MDTFCHTFDPRPEAYPHHLPFKLYDFQKDALRWIMRHIMEGRDGIVEKSRDMGVSWLVLDAFLHCWLFLPGFQAIVGSRKEDLVDNGTMESLFPKLEYTLDRLPFAPEGFSAKRDRTRMRLTNPMNGNVISGESSNPNFGRGGRYRAGLFDEGAFWDEIASAWASAGDSTRCRLMVTTPPEKPNFAKALRFSGRTDVLTLHWKLHPRKDQAWYDQEKARRTPEELAREVDLNWEGSITGRVYPETAHIRFGEFPYRPDWPIWMANDPGHDPDPWAVLWMQVNPENGRWRMVEAGEFTKKLSEWFLPFFGRDVSSEFSYAGQELELIGKVSGWKRPSVMGDLAGTIRNGVTGTSVFDEWTKADVYVNVNRKENDLESRKKAARKAMMRLDVNDTPGCRYALECLKNARYPDLGDQSNRVTPNVKPIHDWTSHSRSALEYFATNVRWGTEETESEDGTFAQALAFAKRTGDYNE